MERNARLILEIWSDYVCPYCYLEKPVLDQLNQRYRDQVEIRWRAFELRPEPEPTLDPKGEYLQRVWQHSVLVLAQRRGMRITLPPVQTRSRLALEAAEYARTAGQFEEFHYEVFRSFFEAGEDIGNIEVLLSIAHEVGLNPLGMRRSLEQAEYHAKVLHDEEVAHELGIESVPTMLLHWEGAPLTSSVPVSGAVNLERLTLAIDPLLEAGAPMEFPRPAERFPKSQDRRTQDRRIENHGI